MAIGRCVFAWRLAGGWGFFCTCSSVCACRQIADTLTMPFTASHETPHIKCITNSRANTALKATHYCSRRPLSTNTKCLYCMLMCLHNAQFTAAATLEPQNSVQGSVGGASGVQRSARATIIGCDPVPGVPVPGKEACRATGPKAAQQGWGWGGGGFVMGLGASEIITCL